MTSSNQKIALVTGASHGLGRAAAVHLSRRGFAVSITARSEEDLKRTFEELDGSGHSMLVADLEEPLETDAVIAHAVGQGALDLFVHCASASPDPDTEAQLESTGTDVTASHVAVTGLAGPLLLKGLKPVLAARDRSNAILISSDWVNDGTSGPPIFSASKAFATQVWRSARLEYLSVGCVLSSLVCGDIATFDLDWEDAKWTLDDPVDAVRAELGLSRIALGDVLRAVDLVVDAELAGITEIQIRPLDPAYVA